MQQVLVRDEPWYVRAFDRTYLKLYAHRDDEEAEGHADALIGLLGVEPGERVLDVACGAGRYARALGRRGLRVTGVDLSEDLLEEARARSPLLPGSPTYLRWDIRDLPFSAQFEGAISMFTSFGYFPERAEDLRVLQGVARALVPGGRFLLDFLNAPAVRAGLEAVTDRTVDGLRVRMERRIEEGAPGGPRIRKHVRGWSTRTDHLELELDEDVRLYTADEIDGLLEEAGLVPVGTRHGDASGAAWDESSPRLVRVAERPARGR